MFFALLFTNEINFEVFAYVQFVVFIDKDKMFGIGDIFN